MLQVALLGEARVAQDGVAVACHARKSLALFAYLLLAPGRRPRRELARLLWGGADETAARTSLRTALQRLPRAMAQAIEAGREHIGLAADAAIELDCHRFARLAVAEDLAALDEAAALYGGELLAGLEPDAAPEFDDWLLRERTRWRQLAQSVFDRLIARHRERAWLDRAHAAAEREAAMSTARRWLALEPAAEAAHRWLMQLHLDAGLREAALAQYEVCRRELAVATGRLPGEQTRALVEALVNPATRVGAAVPATASGAASLAPAAGTGATSLAPGAEPAHSAPPLLATSFVGRSAELAAVECLLAEPDARLITLHGLGGAGKSRLAAAVARQATERWAHGASWVALETASPAPGASAAAALTDALARALGADLPAPPERLPALIKLLQHQQRLLVLDNFEPLLADGDRSAIDTVLALLHGVPNLRLIITSREVLAVQEEWVLVIGGLTVPEAEALAGPVADPSTWPAVALFVDRARQAHRGFSLAAEWPHVVRLCRAVDGLPLALELAAAWVRTVPCAELVRQWGADLASPHRDRAPRHASLDALVRSSWQWLPAGAQQALAALSVFAGSFSHEAAAEVAGATLATISVLVDKALVQRRADGRLDLHPLVRRFASAQLVARPAAAPAVHQRHAEFFEARLRRWRRALGGPDELEADFALAEELPDLRRAAAAWQAQRPPLDPVRLDPTGPDAGRAEAWLMALQTRGLHRELVEQADALLAEPAAWAPSEQGMLLALRGMSQGIRGQAAASQADFDAAEVIARAQNLPELLAFVLVQGCIGLLAREDSSAPLRRLAEADGLLATLTHPTLPFTVAHLRGLLHYGAGRLGPAEAQFRAALELAAQRGSPRMSAQAGTSLATILVRLGRPQEALPLLDQAQPIYERSGNQQFLARVHNVRASAALERSGTPDVARAIASARQAVRLYERGGMGLLALSASHTLARALALDGHTDEARRCFEAAAASAVPTLSAEARLSLVQLESGLGDDAAAARALAHARALAALEAETGHGVVRRCLLLAGAVLGSDALCRGGAAAPTGLAPRVAAWIDGVLSDPEADAAMQRLAQALRPPQAAGGAAGSAAAGAGGVSDLRAWLGV
jgi:DNA-binding SARP family transcriptional activator/predicted ATPase